MNLLKDSYMKFLYGLFRVFGARPKKDKDSLVLLSFVPFLAVFDWAIALLVASLFAGSTAASVISRRKNRKSQEKMAEEARRQQAKEAEAMAKAQKESRTPLPPPTPKKQQLPVQSDPLSSSYGGTGGLKVRSAKRGKSKLRIGSGSGSVGARYA